MKTFSTTTNFIIEYNEQEQDAYRRAGALAATCESNFARALKLFGISDNSGFGASNRITIIVDKYLDSSMNPIFGGVNAGYSLSNIYPITVNPLNSTDSFWIDCGLNGAEDQQIANEIVQMWFVAELVEILMSYCTQIIDKNKLNAWDARSSDGEGLSRVCVELLYPDVCYRYFKPVNIQAWMQSDRNGYAELGKNNDWISVNGFNNAPDGNNYGDVNGGLTFGCAMLFIYYLTTQLGIPLPIIIANGGLNLQQTYHNLQTLAKSGLLDHPQLAQANVSGYAALRAIIDPFFPVGPTYIMSTDNPFPLLYGRGRKLSLTFTQNINSALPSAKSRTVKISAGGNCPPKEYDYEIMDQISQVSCTATVHGFGQPLFAWKINGQNVPGSSFLTPVLTAVLVDNPDDPGVPISKPQSSVPLDCQTNRNKTLSGDLDIKNTTYPGHIVLPVEVTVTEAFVATDPMPPASIVAVIDAEFVQYDDQYYKDRTDCIKALLAKIGNPHWINILLTLPDPAPEGMLGVFAFDQAVQELQVMAQEQPELAKSVAKALSARLGLSASRIMALASQPRTE